MAGIGLSKAQAAEERERFRALVARPAEDSRSAAQKQRDALGAKVDRLLSIGPITSGYREDLLDVDTFLRYGDELKESTDEKTREQRRRFYARAYVKALDSAMRLDAEYARTSPAVLAIQDAFAWLGSAAETVGDQAKPVLKKAGEAAKEGVKAVGRAVEEVGATASNTVYILAGGLALAAITYAYSQGSGRRRARYA